MKSELEITEKQWDFIEKKYGNLLHTISQKITGDYSYSKEDFVQELYISVIDAIDSFKRQGTNKEIEDFLYTPGFGKYLKTTLWNKKNKIGKKIKTYYKINRDVIPITLDSDDGIQYIQVESKNQQSIEDSLNLYKGKLTEEEENIVEEIIKSPNVLYSGGILCYRKLSKKTGISTFLLKKIVKSIEEKMEKMYE